VLPLVKLTEPPVKANVPELLMKLLLPFRVKEQVAPVTVPPLVSEQ